MKPKLLLLPLAGLCVGSVTSAGVFNERLAGGAFDVSVVGDVATTLVAIVVCALLPARPRRSAYAVTAASAAVGAWLVHTLLVATRSAPWMSEAPAQLVNDAVAALATLALAMTFARRRLRLECVVSATALVGVYAVTHGIWHVDRLPHVVATVQQCVVAQFFSVLLALFVYRGARARMLPS